LPFADPSVGSVAANIRVHNGATSLLTRLQEIEYALKFSMGRFIMARLNLLNIIPCMAGLFRAEILHRIRGLDTRHGDDTDLITNMRKQRWILSFSFDAVVWTTVTVTRDHLWRQRMRWRRNMIKIRVSKHRDQFMLGRYGFANAVLAVQVLFNRIVIPITMVTGLLLETIEYGPVNSPHILVRFYWLVLIYLLLKTLATRDVAGTPKLANFWLLFLYPFYLFSLVVPVQYAEISELFRVGAKHPYVPQHVWEEIPW